MDQFLVITGIIWLAVISPGADFAMVSRAAAVQGRGAGLYAAAGIAAACWFHIFYAVFGLALVDRWFPNLIDVLRIIGAVYLVYLGIATAFARPVSGTPDNAGFPPRPASILLAGMLTNGLNPKTSIFVISLYAQIIGPTASGMTQLSYGLLISLSHFLWFAVVAIFLSRPAIRARVLARQRIANGVIGTILILLGLVLAFADLSHGS